MRSLKPIERAFREQIRTEFRKAYEKAKSTGKVRNAAEFAETLGVKRATFYKILDGSSTPKVSVLYRARDRWGVRLNYGGESLERLVPHPVRALAILPEEQQLPLPFAIHGLENKDLSVSLVGKGPDSVEFKVVVKFRA